MCVRVVMCVRAVMRMRVVMCMRVVVFVGWRWSASETPAMRRRSERWGSALRALTTSLPGSTRRQTMP
jgi:hypothetical protein